MPDGAKIQFGGRPDDLRPGQDDVEPVFVQVKGFRGLDLFRLRGLEKVNGVKALMANTHKPVKLFSA